MRQIPPVNSPQTAGKISIVSDIKNAKMDSKNKSAIVSNMAKEAKTFKMACCEKLGISPDAFEETVLWECLPPRHLRVGRWRWRFTKSYFDPDLALIRGVANCVSVRELIEEINYHHYLHPESGFQRNVLKARLSSERLVDFSRKFIPTSN